MTDTDKPLSDLTSAGALADGDTGDNIYITRGGNSRRARLATLTGVPSALSTLQATVAAMREVLTADRTYYVRTDGSDSNTGLVDSAGGAFLTLQHAYDVVANTIDCAGNNVTIQLGAGTFTAGIDAQAPIVGNGSIRVNGDTATPSNCVLSVTNAHGILNRVGTKIVVGGIDFRTTTAGNCIWAYKGSNIIVDGAIIMGACAGDHFVATEGGLIEITTNYTINGSAVNHWHAFGRGEIICQNRTITLTGTPAFSGNFAGNAFAIHFVSGNTFSGSATGSRYLVHKNGVIDTNGGGATYLPGNSTVGAATGGQYI